MQPIAIPIANRDNKLKPIGNSPIANRNEHLTTKEVDILLEDYADLIDPRYKGWFAKRFYGLSYKIVQRYAAEARAEGKNPQALFCSKIKRAV